MECKKGEASCIENFVAYLEPHHSLEKRFKFKGASLELLLNHSSLQAEKEILKELVLMDEAGKLKSFANQNFSTGFLEALGPENVLHITYNHPISQIAYWTYFEFECFALGMKLDRPSVENCRTLFEKPLSPGPLRKLIRLAINRLEYVECVSSFCFKDSFPNKEIEKIEEGEGSEYHRKRNLRIEEWVHSPEMLSWSWKKLVHSIHKFEEELHNEKTFFSEPKILRAPGSLPRKPALPVSYPPRSAAAG